MIELKETLKEVFPENIWEISRNYRKGCYVLYINSCEIDFYDYQSLARAIRYGK